MTAAAPRKFGMGAPVRRKEDRAFVTGKGSYLDDHTPEGTLHAYVLRSSMAHANFRLGGLEAAGAVPGVHLILTHGDLGAIGGLPNKDREQQPDGSPLKKPPRPLLADRVVRFVGDPIAFIVADTLEAAQLAAEAIEVDYDPLPAVVDMAAADGAPSWSGPNSAPTSPSSIREAIRPRPRTPLPRPHRVTRVEIVNNRVVANFMETRGVIAEYGREPGRYWLTIGTQGGHGMRDIIAKDILRIPANNIRVITPDVGGGFGTKIFVYAEYPLAAIASRRLRRPVKWVADRTEHFLGDAHGRDNIATAEMAMDGRGGSWPCAWTCWRMSAPTFRNTPSGCRLAA